MDSLINLLIEHPEKISLVAVLFAWGVWNTKQNILLVSKNNEINDKHAEKMAEMHTDAMDALKENSIRNLEAAKTQSEAHLAIAKGMAELSETVKRMRQLDG